MSADGDQLLEVVYAAIDELNKLLPSDEKLAKARQTRLAGGTGPLDSMATINFVVALDTALAKRFGTTLGVTGDPGLFGENGPMSTVESLVQYLEKRLLEAK